MTVRRCRLDHHLYPVEELVHILGGYDRGFSSGVHYVGQMVWDSAVLYRYAMKGLDYSDNYIH